ncbi:MAG: glycosyltransferase family 4 protein, partial [Nitrospirae bacterium]|nr:glycosyltransferase family 4 protein [Nitrospirota bacterium]
MKIALVRMRYTPFGGAERHLDDLLRLLLDRGHEVHLFTRRWRPGGMERQGMHLHQVPAINGVSLLKVWSFALGVSRLIRGKGFDIVQSFDRTWSQDVYRAGDGCHIAWMLRRRIILPWHRWLLQWVNPLHWSLLALERRVFSRRGSAHLIANSEMVKRQIVRYYGRPAEEITVLRNGIDLDRFNPEMRRRLRERARERFGVGPREALLLFVGSDHPRKGLAVLLEAVRRLPLNQVRLVVVGKGWVGPWRRLARRRGVSDRVTFTGPIEEVEWCYSAADIFVLPTVYDPMSNATLEAMACGLPVVTTDANGTSELIEDGVSGYVLATPVDPGLLAERLTRLMDASSRDAMGKRGAE